MGEPGGRKEAAARAGRARGGAPSLAFALLVALALAAFFTLRDRAGERAAPAPLDGAPAIEPAAAPSRAGAVAPERVALAPEARSATAETALTGDPGEAPIRAIGRVVDEQGAPLAGLRVSLEPPPDDRWHSAAPADAPNEFAAVSAEDGTFEILCPPFDIHAVVLCAEGTRARAAFRRVLSPAEERLPPGTTDLGTIVLGAGGGVAGQVVDEDGRPLAGIRVDCSPGRAFTDGAGEFLVLGVRPGEAWVRAEHPEWIAPRHVDPVQVAAGHVSSGVVIRMRRAPAISGRVVDGEGRGIAGAQVETHPAGGGLLHSAVSAADGSFRVFLKHDRPCRLEVRREGYEPLPCEASPLYAAGAEDVEIVLRPARYQLLRVLDARTRAPVERFGAGLVMTTWADGSTGSSSTDDDEPEVARHPGGEVRLALERGRFDYKVHAPGYAPTRRPLPVLPEGIAQEVLLAPGAAIAGELHFDGRPASGAGALLARDSVRPQEHDEIPVASEREYDLDRFAGRRRRTACAPDGSFRFEDLAAGTYRLELSAEGAAPLVLRRLRVREGEQRELGALEAAVGGRIEGRVITAHGTSPGGLRLVRGPSREWIWGGSAQTDDEGRFAFHGLSAGAHHLSVMPLSGVLRQAQHTLVELGPGERRFVEIDLRPHASARVELEILLNGAPAPDLRASAVADAEGGRRLFIGRSDARGRVAGSVEAVGPAQLRIAGETGLPIALSERIDLAAGAVLTLSIAVRAGRLALELPPGFADGTSPQLGVELRHGAEGEPQRISVPRPPDVGASGPGVVELGHVAPGTWRARIEVWEDDLDDLHDPEDLDAIDDAPVRVRAVEGRAEVRAGERTLLELR